MQPGKAVKIALATVAAAFLAQAAGSAAAGASASTQSNCPNGQTPALTFAVENVTVNVGSGGSAAPVAATCGGVAVTPVNVQYVITDGSTHAVVANSGGSTSATLGSGSGSTLVVAGASSAGTFTVSATWSGVSANVDGVVVGALRGTLPPNDPSANAVYRFGAACRSYADVSPRCTLGVAADITAARQAEQIGPLVLPDNFTQLTPPQQLFVLVNLERSARGLPVVPGLTDALDEDAQRGAEDDADPYEAGLLEGQSGGDANHAGGDAPTLGAVFAWLYDDGLNADGTSDNYDCSSSQPSGCWGHRNGLLFGANGNQTCLAPCAMGAGFATNTRHYKASYTTETIWGSAGDQVPFAFTWSSELAHLPACEQTGDTCTAADVPPLPLDPPPTTSKPHSFVDLSIPSKSRHNYRLNVRAGASDAFTVTVKIRHAGHVLFQLVRKNIRSSKSMHPWTFPTTVLRLRSGDKVQVVITLMTDKGVRKSLSGNVTVVA